MSFDLKDLYTFYPTDKIDGIITDSRLNPNIKKKYEKYTKVINTFK